MQFLQNIDPGITFVQAARAPATIAMRNASGYLLLALAIRGASVQGVNDVLSPECVAAFGAAPDDVVVATNAVKAAVHGRLHAGAI